MPVAKKHEIGMNLIADEKHVVLGADSCNPVHFILAPTAPDGIMRIAENHQLCLRPCSPLYKVFKIDRIPAVFIAQRIVGERSLMVSDRMDKRMVDRLLDNDFIPGLRERLNHRVNDWNDAGGKDHPFLLQFNVVLF